MAELNFKIFKGVVRRIVWVTLFIIMLFGVFIQGATAAYVRSSDYKGETGLIQPQMEVIHQLFGIE